MRVLSIDWGTKGMGISISDELLLTVKPLQNYFFAKQYNFDEAFEVIQKTIKEYKSISIIVIGYPVTMSGNNSSQTNSSIDFSNSLKDKLKELDINIKVDLYDERLTTKIAKSKFGNKPDWNLKKDMYSSYILLEEYLSTKVI